MIFSCQSFIFLSTAFKNSSNLENLILVHLWFFFSQRKQAFFPSTGEYLNLQASIETSNSFLCKSNCCIDLRSKCEKSRFLKPFGRKSNQLEIQCQPSWFDVYFPDVFPGRPHKSNIETDLAILFIFFLLNLILFIILDERKIFLQLDSCLCSLEKIRWQNKIRELLDTPGIKVRNFRLAYRILSSILYFLWFL